MAASGVALIGPRPADNTTGEQFAKFQPGYRLKVGDVEYEYVKFNNGAGNVASADGGAAYWKDFDSFEVTSDKTDSQAGASNPSGCAGIFIGVMTDGYYGWVAKNGPYTVRLAAGDSNGAVGNKIFAPASDADLDLRSEADSSVSAAEIPATELGRQMAAGSNNTALVLLDIP